MRNKVFTKTLLADWEPEPLMVAICRTKSLGVMGELLTLGEALVEELLSGLIGANLRVILGFNLSFDFGSFLVGLRINP